MHEVKSVRELLDQISRGEILLPEFQRGYVWNGDQVRGLVQTERYTLNKLYPLDCLT